MTELVYSIANQTVYVVDYIFGVLEIFVGIDSEGNVTDNYIFQVWAAEELES